MRPPAVAGTFYPADPVVLREMVEHYIAEGRTTHTSPKALIAPHAGYIYSGPIAGSAYRALSSLGAEIKRVILLGPSHHVAFPGLAAPTTTHFRTPLGEIPVDQDALQQIADLPQLQLLDEPHRIEHSLEVQLPFLQQALGAFSLLPLVVGQASDEEVASVLDRLWGGSETLIVISSDLSHYATYEKAQQQDQATSRAIEQLNGCAIHHEDACGRRPIQGLLRTAQRRGLHCELLDLRNSGDTAGDRNRVVGYGAYLFSEEHS